MLMANKVLLGSYVMQDSERLVDDGGSSSSQDLVADSSQLFLRQSHCLEYSSFIPSMPTSYEMTLESLDVDSPTTYRIGPYKIVVKPFKINKWLRKFFPKAGRMRKEWANFWIQMENVSFPQHLTGTASDILAVFPKAETIKIGDYIDKGSDGVIHKIDWSGQQFAIKLHSKEDEFRKEAATHFVLDHPNIVTPRGYAELRNDATESERKSKFGIIMELMDGDFQNFVKNKRARNEAPFRDEIDAVEVMLQLARALMYMHFFNIIHRDVKPGNMLIRTGASNFRSGVEVKLGDFGTSKLADTSKLTARIGTGCYWAPEVIKVEEGSCGYSLKADVYSFGMTCYAILCGKTPLGELEDLSPDKFYSKIRGSWMLPGRRPQLPRNTNSSLAKIIQQCWHDKPEERPPFDIICWALEIVESQMRGVNPSLDERVYPLKAEDSSFGKLFGH